MLQPSDLSMDNAHAALVRSRDVARRLVWELLGICAVMVAGAWMPVHDVPGTSWAWLAPVSLFVAHILLGLLVVVDGARLVAGSMSIGGQATTQAGAGLLVSVFVVVVGTVALAGGPNSVQPEMVMAWIAGLAIYGWSWVSASAVLRALTRTTTDAGVKKRDADTGAQREPPGKEAA